MAKGRKKKPDKLKVLEGTFRKDRSNPNAPKSDDKKLQPPSWLPVECWGWFVVIKERLGAYALDSASYTEAAALIAMRIREIEDCNEIITREGRTYRSETLSENPTIDADGEPYTPIKIMIKGHPAVSQKNEAMRHLQSLLSEFGLTPSSISKVGGSKRSGNDANPWEKF